LSNFSRQEPDDSKRQRRVDEHQVVEHFVLDEQYLCWARCSCRDERGLAVKDWQGGDGFTGTRDPLLLPSRLARILAIHDEVDRLRWTALRVGRITK
jgi:hypothetical protein